MNMSLQSKQYTAISHRVIGWLVHAFTACGALAGLFSLDAIYHQHPVAALWWMVVAILIDAVDGMFARQIHIKTAVPQINGELLDNIVDFFTYTLVPCFFLMQTNLLPGYLRLPCVVAIVFASSYQFTQIDAKTEDHFFKGFPSYWNIVIFYLFFWQTKPLTNVIIILTLAILSFIPIKYVYPSRLDYLTHHPLLRLIFIVFTILWGICTAALLWLYPATNHLLIMISISYCLFYFTISLYRTYFWKQ